MRKKLHKHLMQFMRYYQRDYQKIGSKFLHTLFIY